MTDKTWSEPKLTYSVRTGEYREDGVLCAIGYSGTHGMKNNPDYEHVAGAGPIPRGRYLIGRAIHSKRTGPVVLPLRADGHDAYGRSAFQIHGDSIRSPGNASSGCIVLPRPVRENIANLVRIWKTLTLEVID